METTKININSHSQSRLRHIDVARGIAILCVILGHLSNNSINRVVYTFHLPIFFLISGYFLNTETSTFNYIRKKLRTLVIPYIITSIAIILFAMLRGFIINRNAVDPAKDWIDSAIYGSGYYLRGVINVNEIGPIWFLWASFFSGIIVRSVLKTDYRIRILTILVCFVLGYSTTRWLFCFPLSLQTGLCSAFYVYLGYIFRKAESSFTGLSKEIKTILFILSLLVTASFILNFKSFWLVRCDFGRGFEDIIGSLCSCFVVFTISYYIDRLKYLPRLLAYIGQNSIFILCIHNIEMYLIPWNDCMDLISPTNETVKILLKILFKFILDVSLACILSKINPVRKAFGGKPYK